MRRRRGLNHNKAGCVVSGGGPAPPRHVFELALPLDTPARSAFIPLIGRHRRRGRNQRNAAASTWRIVTHSGHLIGSKASRGPRKPKWAPERPGFRPHGDLGRPRSRTYLSRTSGRTSLGAGDPALTQHSNRPEFSRIGGLPTPLCWPRLCSGSPDVSRLMVHHIIVDPPLEDECASGEIVHPETFAQGGLRFRCVLRHRRGKSWRLSWLPATRSGTSARRHIAPRGTACTLSSCASERHE